MTPHLPEDFVDFVRCLREQHKRAAARPKDLADVATLQELRDRVERS
jgi:hypothetical protein